MSEPTVLDQFRLDGRVCLLTGGSKGLGQAIAHGFAEAGANIVIASRDAAQCQAVADEIARATGCTALGLGVDVTAETSVRTLFETVMERCGRLDVLLNSAGINIRHPIEDYPLDEFQRVVGVNLTGTWLCCREAARIMKPAGQGSVINIASVLGAIGLAERTAYCSSKSAVIGLTRTLGLEWAASNVRCNALCPGPFLTEMNRVLLSEPAKVAALVGQTALNRWGELKEIQGAALFLASDASTYMTGASLFIDGGWSAQ